MLSNSSIILSREILNNLTYNGKTVELKRGSILSVLCNTTDIQDNLSDNAFDSTVGENDKGFKNSAEQRISAQSKMLDGSGVDVHTADTTFVVNELTTRISNSINIARNFVNPVIRDLYKGASAISQSITGTGGVNDVVRLVQPHNVYSSEALQAVINPLVGFGSISPEVHKLAPTHVDGLMLEDIIATCTTGLPDIDNRVVNIIKQNAESVNNYLNDCFNLGSDVPFSVDDRHDSIDPFTNHGYLVGFLFLHGVINGRGRVPAGEISSVDSNMMLKLRNVLATRLKRQMKINNEADATDNIVLARWTSRVNKNYVVNGPNYRKWLAANPVHCEGGFVIYMRSGIADPTATTLSANIERYNKEWQALLKANMRTSKVDADAKINAYIRRELATVIRDTDMFEDDVRSDIQARLFDRLNGKGYYNQLDLDTYIRDLCCTVLAPKTDVYKILTIIDHEMKDEEVTLPQAISIAVDQLLADWVFGQLTVV